MDSPGGQVEGRLDTPQPALALDGEGSGERIGHHFAIQLLDHFPAAIAQVAEGDASRLDGEAVDRDGRRQPTSRPGLTAVPGHAVGHLMPVPLPVGQDLQQQPGRHQGHAVHLHAALQQGPESDPQAQFFQRQHGLGGSARSVGQFDLAGGKGR